MLINESEMADERAGSVSSPNMLANSAVPIPDVAAAALLVVVAVNVRILSSGVIGGSDMVPVALSEGMERKRKNSFNYNQLS